MTSVTFLGGHLEHGNEAGSERETPMGGLNQFHDNFGDINIGVTRGSSAPPVSDTEHQRATTATRLRARLFFAGRLDRDVEDGIAPMPGSPLAVHVARLTSVDEREALARSLRHALGDMRSDHEPFSPRIRYIPTASRAAAA